MKLTVTEYQLDYEVDRTDFPGMQIKFRRVESPFYEGVKWAAKWLGRCMNKDGEWEHEPTPSARDNDFFQRCRFDSLEEVYELAIKAPRRVNGIDITTRVEHTNKG